MYEKLIQVEWGDCDAAGIVFYPTYFYWFDSTYHHFSRAHGFGQRELLERFGAVTPLVDVGARFLAPATYGDTLRITAEVVEWSDKKYKIQYVAYKSDQVVCTGHEVRAWAMPIEGGGLRGAPIRRNFAPLCPLE